MAIVNIPALLPSFGDIAQSLPIRISTLGTPIYDDVTFRAGSYTNDNGDTVTYKGFSLESVQITVNQSKNIVESQVAGRNGTVKEYISMGDFEVNINAKVSELFNVFPYDQMETFNRIKNSPETVKVTSKVLNEIFEVEDFVINDITLSTIPGSINEVDLQIRMTSDEDIDLQKFLL